MYIYIYNKYPTYKYIYISCGYYDIFLYEIYSVIMTGMVRKYKY